jgi:hypothetical protein
MRNLLMIILFTLFVSCTSSPPLAKNNFDFNDLFFVTKTNQFIYLGMSKADVLSLLGQPNKVIMTEDYKNGIAFSYGEHGIVTSIVIADYSDEIEFSTLRGINIRSDYKEILGKYGYSFFKEEKPSHDLIYWFDPKSNIALKNKEELDNFSKKSGDLVIGLFFMFNDVDKSKLMSISIASFGKEKVPFDRKKFIEEIIKKR